MRYYTLLSLLLVALIFGGCKTPETTAYRTTGVLIVTVDAAMVAWSEAVKLNLVTVDQRQKVKAVYDRYYLAIQAEKAAVIAYKSNPDQDALFRAISAVNAATAQIIQLIESLLPQENLLRLKGIK